MLEELILFKPDVMHFLREIPHTLTKLHFDVVTATIKQATMDSINAFPKLRKITANTIDKSLQNDTWYIKKYKIVDFLSVPNEVQQLQRHTILLDSNVNLLTNRELELRNVKVELCLSLGLQLNPYNFTENLRGRVTIASLDKISGWTNCWYTHDVNAVFPNLENAIIKAPMNGDERSYCTDCMKTFIQTTPKLNRLTLIVGSVEYFALLFKSGKNITHLQISTSKVPVISFHLQTHPTNSKVSFTCRLTHYNCLNGSQ